MPCPVRLVHVLTTQLTGIMTYRAAHVVDSGSEVVRVTLTDSYLEITVRPCVSNLLLKVNNVFQKLELVARILWNTWTVYIHIVHFKKQESVEQDSHNAILFSYFWEDQNSNADHDINKF